MGDPPPRRRSLCLAALWVALLVAGVCSSDAAAAPASKERLVSVVGAGECSDCAAKHINNADAFKGLHVAVSCKAADGAYQIKGVGGLDRNGKFSVKLPSDLVNENGELKAECFAQLHGGSKGAPCPEADSALGASKAVLEASEEGKQQQTFRTTGKLKFSTETCEAAFFWGHPYPWFKPLPKFPLPTYPLPPFPFFPKPFFPPEAVPASVPTTHPIVPAPNPNLCANYAAHSGVHATANAGVYSAHSGVHATTNAGVYSAHSGVYTAHSGVQAANAGVYSAHSGVQATTNAGVYAAHSCVQATPNAGVYSANSGVQAANSSVYSAHSGVQATTGVQAATRVQATSVHTVSYSSVQATNAGVQAATCVQATGIHTVSYSSVQATNAGEEAASRVHASTCVHATKNSSLQASTGVQAAASAHPTGVHTASVQTTARTLQAATRVHPTGVHTASVQASACVQASARVQATRVQPTSVQASARVQATRVHPASVQAPRVQATGVQAAGVQTTSVQAAARVQATGVYAANVHSTEGMPTGAGVQAASANPDIHTHLQASTAPSLLVPITRVRQTTPQRRQPEALTDHNPNHPGPPLALAHQHPSSTITFPIN